MSASACLLRARCSSRAGVWLLAFAVAAVGELVAKPAGAAGVAIVPPHRDLVLGTPARVLFVLRGGELRVRLRRGGRLRAHCELAAVCACMAACDGRGDLLVEGAALGSCSGAAFALLRRLLARVELASQAAMTSASQGSSLVMRSCRSRSLVSRAVYMNSMLPTLS